MNRKSELVKSIYAAKKEFSQLERHMQMRRVDLPKTVRVEINLSAKVPFKVVKKEIRRKPLLLTRIEHSPSVPTAASFEALPLSATKGPPTVRKSPDPGQPKKQRVNSVRTVSVVRRNSSRPSVPYRLIRTVKD